jgi:hypothetical protein
MRIDYSVSSISGGPPYNIQILVNGNQAANIDNSPGAGFYNIEGTKGNQVTFKVNGKDVVVNPTATTFADGCVRYTKEKPATVTLYDGKGIVQVYSSRLGNLPFKKAGDAITVNFPLDTSDILIFSRTVIPVEKYPWNPPMQVPVKKK